MDQSGSRIRAFRLPEVQQCFQPSGSSPDFFFSTLTPNPSLCPLYPSLFETVGGSCECLSPRSWCAEGACLSLLLLLRLLLLRFLHPLPPHRLLIIIIFILRFLLLNTFPRSLVVL